ncbi:MAG: hypothetical protein KHX31_00350 [Akkermansia sp.]|uniref:hypothetical protein n=1 Tax=Akkermansia sp. TaxID=1872421 RepID=UPI0025C53D52|nr:hypothetical protein [Akkermansia sp.]MBS5507060.1 hypothetical protein [Akkermansia sp.]
MNEEQKFRSLFQFTARIRESGSSQQKTGITPLKMKQGHLTPSAAAEMVRTLSLQGDTDLRE